MNRHFLFLPVVLCWMIALATGSAQSFLKFYNPPQNLNLEAQSVFLYPNGDYGIALRRPNNAVAFLRTDDNGQQISFAAQPMPENNPHFRELDGSVVTAFTLADSLVVWKRNAAQDTVWRTARQLAPAIVSLQVENVEENNAGEIFVTGFYFISASS
ncbi:MAG: hypothetical protein IT262_23895, partial [Saprospiraceae bacterium]|nr:hypothetical protein [Saprospiraceae bacterium]